jgi:hypothetical protein
MESVGNKSHVDNSFRNIVMGVVGVAALFLAWVFYVVYLFAISKAQFVCANSRPRMVIASSNEVR